MDADVVAEDKIIRDKIGYLNIPFFGTFSNESICDVIDGQIFELLNP